MKRLDIYVETSVWNFLHTKQSPEKRKITGDFFRESGDFNLYISDVVLEEVAAAPEKIKASLLSAISKYGPYELADSEESLGLARKYIEAGVIPENQLNDARHVAVAVVEEMDIIVSWNMRHIVRYKTRIGVNAVSRLNGYKEIEILTPEEV